MVAQVVRPRLVWVPPRSRSLGPECVEFWRDAGGRLFGWQELAIDGILGVDDDDRFVSTDDGLNVARQNGKGVVLQALEAFFAFELGYDVVMHTAHEFATAQEHQRRLKTFIQDCPHLHAKVRDKGGYMDANGKESINLKSGARIVFKARTKGGGRGYSGDLLVWDEAMVIPDSVVGAQRPMMRATRSRHGLKVIYAGSAVDQHVHEYGVMFSKLRENGLAKSPKVSWHEWSAPFENPSEMTEASLRDRSWWPLANPSMPEGLVLEETMADEIELMPFRTAAVELGGVGDWPRTDGGFGSVIGAEAWADCFDKNSMPLAPVCLAADIAPDRSWAAIAAAGWNQDGKIHVEVGEHRRGTHWVVGRLAELVEKFEPVWVGCDAYAVLPGMEVLPVKTVSAPEHGLACGRFVDAVADDNLRHLGSDELRSAVLGAKTRPLGDAAWAWSRKGSPVDITPLVAATLALSAAIDNPVGGQQIW